MNETIQKLGRAYQYVYNEATNGLYSGHEEIGPEVRLLPYRTQDALRILLWAAMVVGKEEG
jgi:hypothetical protein